MKRIFWAFEAFWQIIAGRSFVCIVYLPKKKEYTLIINHEQELPYLDCLYEVFIKPGNDSLKGEESVLKEAKEILTKD